LPCGASDTSAYTTRRRLRRLRRTRRLVRRLWRVPLMFVMVWLPVLMVGPFVLAAVVFLLPRH
jgi:hypothetical protein